MKKASEEMNICLLFKCSICCNPVKIDSLRLISPRDGLPFVEMKGLLVPRLHMEIIRLRPYKCILFNSSTGLCKDYKNRPNICRNTFCPAFKFKLEEKRKISYWVNQMKKTSFIRIS